MYVFPSKWFTVYKTTRRYYRYHVFGKHSHRSMAEGAAPKSVRGKVQTFRMDGLTYPVISMKLFHQPRSVWQTSAGWIMERKGSITLSKNGARFSGEQQQFTAKFFHSNDDCRHQEIERHLHRSQKEDRFSDNAIRISATSCFYLAFFPLSLPGDFHAHPVEISGRVQNYFAENRTCPLSRRKKHASFANLFEWGI